MGLALTQLKRSGDALAEFRRAAELEPAQPRYQYVYAVALHSAGRTTEAIALLKQTLQNHPADADILSALVSFSRIAGDAASTLGYAEQRRSNPATRELPGNGARSC